MTDSKKMGGPDMLDQLREAFPQIDWHIPKYVVRKVFGYIQGYTLEVTCYPSPGGLDLYYAHFTDPDDRFSINLSGGESYNPVSAVLGLQERRLKYKKAGEAFDIAFPEGLESPKEVSDD